IRKLVCMLCVAVVNHLHRDGRDRLAVRDGSDQARDRLVARGHVMRDDADAPAVAGRLGPPLGIRQAFHGVDEGSVGSLEWLAAGVRALGPLACSFPRPPGRADPVRHALPVLYTWPRVASTLTGPPHSERFAAPSCRLPGWYPPAGAHERPSRRSPSSW